MAVNIFHLCVSIGGKLENPTLPLPIKAALLEFALRLLPLAVPGTAKDFADLFYCRVPQTIRDQFAGRWTWQPTVAAATHNNVPLGDVIAHLMAAQVAISDRMGREALHTIFTQVLAPVLAKQTPAAAAAAQQQETMPVTRKRSLSPAPAPQEPSAEHKRQRTSRFLAGQPVKFRTTVDLPWQQGKVAEVIEGGVIVQGEYTGEAQPLEDDESFTNYHFSDDEVEVCVKTM